MRSSFAAASLLVASLIVTPLLVSGTAGAAPHAKPPAKSKVGHVDPLPSTKADGAVAGRALLVKELPKSLSTHDRKALEAVAAELRADHLESSLVLFRAWAAGGSKTLLREEAVNAALWVFREGVLARSEELANTADRVRFFDERNAAADDSLALLKAAVITRKPVLVAKLVVLAPYVKETRGDEKRERQVPRDALDAEIRSLETKCEEIKNERDAARAAFKALDAKNGQHMQVLAALVKHATDMRVGASGGKT